LESALVTVMQRLSASMATMATTRTHVRLTATTVLTTLQVACLSVPARGSMASTVPATVVAFTAGATTVAAIMDADTTDADLADVVALSMAVLIAVDSAAEIVASTAVADFTVEAGSTAAPVGSTVVEVFTEGPVDSTAEVVAASTEVAEATAADIGKTSKFYTCGEKRLAESTAGRFLFQKC
jgi:hypothetical protein